MISPITKVFGIFSLVLVCSTLWYYSQYHKQVAENEVLLSNIASYKVTVNTQKETINFLKVQQEGINAAVVTLTTNNDRLNSESSEALAEVNRLRGTLLQRSIENPFSVSNMNTDKWQTRKNDILGRNKDNDAN